MQSTGTVSKTVCMQALSIDEPVQMVLWPTVLSIWQVSVFSSVSAQCGKNNDFYLYADWERPEDEEIDGENKAEKPSQLDDQIPLHFPWFRRGFKVGLFSGPAACILSSAHMARECSLLNLESTHTQNHIHVIWFCGTAPACCTYK